MFCIPILAKTTDQALEKMARAESLADVMEIRLDVMEVFDLGEIVRAASKPVIITYRSRKDGGQGAVDYGTRIRYLSRAIEVGADFVDVEYSLPLEYRQEIFKRRDTSRLIVSTHLSRGTPPEEELQEILKRLAATGADIIKIVTRANAPADNLRVLGLIPLGQGLGLKIIAFCMGSVGRISRIACLPMGGYLTFASLDRGEESADGQMPVREMKKILGILAA
jgi:3-dehydroquinate dehydratase type I